MSYSIIQLIICCIVLCSQSYSYVLPSPASDLSKTTHLQVEHARPLFNQSLSTRDALVAADLSSVFVLQGNWDENKKQVLEFAVYGVQQLAASALTTLILEGASNPSFQRYFEADDIAIVRRMFTRVLGYLAAPGTQTLPDCENDIQHASRIYIYNGDMPGATDCAAGRSNAYFDFINLSPAGPVNQPLLALCESFWTHKLHLPVPGNPLYPYVHSLGPSIDDGTLAEGPATSISSILLHELLHSPELSKPVLQHFPRPPGHPLPDLYQIEDLVLVHPNDVRIIAYGAFYSMKVKDSQWGAEEPSIFNVDSYVSLALETFYRNPNEEWDDPPAAVMLFEADGSPHDPIHGLA